MRYKRIDLAVAACNRLGRRLLVIGRGEEAETLRKMAGPRIHFLGRVSDGEVRAYLRKCRALIFPGEEDFGLVPIEANACGRPVIALARGGALETLRGIGPDWPPLSDPTAVFFSDQTEDSLCRALEWFEARADFFVPAVIQNHAARFDTSRFLREFQAYLLRKLSRHQQSSRDSRALSAGHVH